MQHCVSNAFLAQCMNSPFLFMISIRKGADILIPIIGLNQSKALWGEDAREFR